MTTSKKESRRESRRIAIEIVFSYLARDKMVTIDETIRHVLEEVEEGIKDEFAVDLSKLVVQEFGKLRLILKIYAPEFPYEKIAPINRAVLLLGLAEMKFLDTPPIVVINEYIELAKVFGEEKSAGFINAVLDSFRQHIGKDRKE
jgi:N utilization substance protein B